jgi:hypothetical protein
MKKLLFISGIIASLWLISACSSQQTQDQQIQDSALATESLKPDSALANVQKYKIKSGIVVYEMEAMTMKQKMTLYFDDYGKKEVSEVEAIMMGLIVHTRTFAKDGYMYTLNMTKKEGKKMKMSGIMDIKNINFNALTPDIMNKWRMQKLENEDFAGKKCEKFSIDYPEGDMKGTFLVWNGIAIKSDMKMGFANISAVATSIKEDVEVPSEKFEIPEGFLILEVNPQK